MDVLSDLQADSLLTDNVSGKVIAITGSAEKPRLLAMHPVTRSGFDATAVLQAYDELGNPQGDEVEVLEIFNRVTARNPFAVSLDGRLAAFGNYHAGTRDPRMVVLDGDGHPAGAPVRLLDTGESPSLDCFALTPLKAGVLASFVDVVAHVMHFTEVSNAGQVVAQTAWDAPTGLRCGIPWREPTGVLIPFEGGEEIYRYDAGTVVKVASIQLAADGSLYRWLLDGAEPLVARSLAGGGVEFARLRGADLLPLHGPPLSELTFAVPAIDGRIFVATQPYVVGGASNTADLDISEIRCGSASD